MGMITTLKIEEAKITGGRIISTLAYETKNQSLHLCSLPLSRCMIYCLECDSNNTTRAIVPRESRTINQYLDVFEQELNDSKEFVDSPTGVLEVTYKILLPTPVEMKKFTNQKIERVALAIQELANVMMSVDSSGTKLFVEMADFEKIEQALAKAKKVVQTWIGTGEPSGKPGEFDTGREVPDSSLIGQLQPDTDADSAVLNEPSADRGTVGLPDAPDHDGSLPE